LKPAREMSTDSRARQFPVGQRRDVPVADAGCGCRPRRLRLLSLPWFLRSSGGGAQRNSPSASFSSSSCAGATRSSTTGGYSSSLATRRRQQQETPPASKKKRTNKAAADDGGVGVAVEKDSYDPRADFRDSMALMVVEMGLCDWDGLRCMLRRLLALNAPRHHAAILAAFAEVCAQIASSPAAYHRQHRR
jgi:uncharacterized protein (TIGR01568 family)